MIIQRLFSEKKIKKGDKVGIWMKKNLASKKENEDLIKAYDKEGPQDYKPLAKRTAIAGAIGGSVGSVIGDKATEKLIPFAEKTSATNKAVKAAAMGAGIAAGGYYGVKRNVKKRKTNEKLDKRLQKGADQSKVAAGKMTKEEYAEKYGK